MKTRLILVLSALVSFAYAQENPGGTHWVTDGNTQYYNSGNIGVGTTAQTNYKLAVDGKIHTKEVQVDQNNWPDYVFTKDYQLPSLEEVERHLKEKGHLINIPSANEVKAQGIELGEMNRLLLEKVDELTLYLLNQTQKSKELKGRIQLLKYKSR